MMMSERSSLGVITNPQREQNLSPCATSPLQFGQKDKNYHQTILF
jgi:hypothetical protein